MEAENRIERTLGREMLAVLAVGCLLVLGPFFTAFCFALILVVATWPTPCSSPEAGRYGHVLGGIVGNLFCSSRHLAIGRISAIAIAAADGLGAIDGLAFGLRPWSALRSSDRQPTTVLKQELTSVPSSLPSSAISFNLHHFLPALFALAVAACAGQAGSPASPGQTATAQNAAGTILIGTGGATGVYYPAGSAICRMYNRNRGQQGQNCAIERTEGSIANIEGLRTGELDMAIVQSDWQYHAYEGDGPFAEAGPYPDLRAVLSLHAEPFTVVAREDSGITTVADLRGKRVNIGNPGSGQRATTEAVMAANGWTMADFALASELPSEEQAAALAGGRVDAIVFTVGHPSGEIYDATQSTAARLVPITGPAVDRLVADTPYYAKATIPGGLYHGADSPTPTFGVRATLVTTAETPDDVVYLMVKSVFENLEEFKGLHPALAKLDRREMARAALSAPLHPGAERYYREAGLI